jgi:hypothetical protein
LLPEIDSAIVPRPNSSTDMRRSVVRSLAILSAGLLFYFRLVSVLYVDFLIKNFAEFFKDFFINLQFFLHEKSRRKKMRRAVTDSEINFTEEISRRFSKQRREQFAKNAWW